ncbi:NAD(P)H-dependent oxidoreductase [Parabacteroides sp. OttesenSCG-928-K15]|nr:NAD(P)H-dependent oxidoreductase [Parabacteroides sp. OttesenSCG-928-K15]
MKHIIIISSSIREGRLSHRIALYLKQYLEENHLATAEVLDLKSYNFPLFTERLVYMDNPSKEVLDFAGRFVKADGVLIVSPVYNASFPASLKNVIDLFVKEWQEKVVAVATVTFGTNAGIATVKELQALLLKMGAIVVPTAWTVLSAGKDFEEDGKPLDADKTASRAQPMVRQLLDMINKLSV